LEGHDGPKHRPSHDAARASLKPTERRTQKKNKKDATGTLVAIEL